MRCPRCGELGQEVPNAQGASDPGRTGGVYLSSTPGCRVMQFDAAGIQMEAPEEDPDSEA